MAIRGRLVTLAALGMIVLPAAARADIKHFLNYCSPGAMRSCASIIVETTANGGGGTNVVIKIRNLQGYGWYGDNTGGSAIRRLGLITPQIQGASGLSVTTEGLVGQSGSPDGYWFLAQPAGLGGLIEVAATTNSSREGGIVGCADPTYNLINKYYTCGDNSGWIVFSFQTTNSWSANDAQVAWLTDGFHQYTTEPIVECGTDGGYGVEGRIPCTHVTPEPVTLVLLGSGMAGVGGMNFLKRRRRKHEEPATPDA